MIDTVIKIEDLKKSFGNHEVLKGVNLEVGKGEVVSIIGASGSGKSTMLRCINLLERPTSGKISYLGEDILAPEFNTTAYRTKVGMVFQHFNLFNNIYCVGFTVCNPDSRCCGCNLDETVFHKIIPHKIITAETKRSYGYYTSNFPIIQASEHCSCYPSESFSVKKILTFKRRFKLCDVATHISHNQPEPHHHKRYVIK